MYIELIDYDNVIIIGDETWQVKSSKQIRNNIYDGEEVDYTLPETSLEKV